MSITNVASMRQNWLFGNTPALRRARKLSLMSVIGLIDAGIVSLRQLGVIARLPDVRIHLIDSNFVTTSRKAYSLGFPDAPLGALLYAIHLVLATSAAADEPRVRKAGTYALAVTTLLGVVAASDFLFDMIAREKRLCPYCLTAAAVSLAAFYLAWRQLHLERSANAPDPVTSADPFF